jgi:hypothetical protein
MFDLQAGWICWLRSLAGCAGWLAMLYTLAGWVTMLAMLALYLCMNTMQASLQAVLALLAGWLGSLIRWIC